MRQARFEQSSFTIATMACENIRRVGNAFAVFVFWCAAGAIFLQPFWFLLQPFGFETKQFLVPILGSFFGSQNWDRFYILIQVLILGTQECIFGSQNIFWVPKMHFWVTEMHF